MLNTIYSAILSLFATLEMSNLRYNKQMTYSVEQFSNHVLQDIMALFLCNPDLYSEYKLQKDRQGYFFNRFRRFADEYYTFNVEREIDTCIYFASAQKERCGETNVCGGLGKVSNSTIKEFKSRHKEIESKREEQIDYFRMKYRVRLEPGNDERLFLGVHEIWNKLENAMEIVAASPWANIVTKSYKDDTGTLPIPSGLEKHLIPISMRNRIWQKYLNSKRSTGTIRFCSVEEFDMAENAEPETTKTDVLSQQTVFVRPPELDDEDW